MRVGVSGQSRAAGPVPGDSSGHVQTVQVAQLRMPHRRTASADPRVPARGGRAFVRFVHRPDLGARTLSAWRQFNGCSHEQHRSRRVCSLFASVPAGHPGAPCSLVARACPREPCVLARPGGPVEARSRTRQPGQRSRPGSQASVRPGVTGRSRRGDPGRAAAAESERWP